MTIRNEHGRELAYHLPAYPLPEIEPGDFLLHHSTAIQSRLIRFGERLRFRGTDRTFAFWNHASICVAPGVLVEALGPGISRSPLSKYEDATFASVRVAMSRQDIAEAIGFANHAVGERYGFLTLVGVALHMLSGGKLTIGLDGTEICSGLVARCLERGPTVFEHHDPSNITPADLGRHFNVPAPDGRRT